MHLVGLGGPRVACERVTSSWRLPRITHPRAPTNSPRPSLTKTRRNQCLPRFRPCLLSEVVLQPCIGGIGRVLALRDFDRLALVDQPLFPRTTRILAKENYSTEPVKMKMPPAVVGVKVEPFQVCSEAAGQRCLLLGIRRGRFGNSHH